jgi:predicted TIM-barrel fold metal-dependent hydrolase
MAVVSEYVADLPPDEREAVLGGNAQRFWNLPAAIGAGNET